MAEEEGEEKEEYESRKEMQRWRRANLLCSLERALVLLLFSAATLKVLFLPLDAFRVQRRAFPNLLLLISPAKKGY